MNVYTFNIILVITFSIIIGILASVKAVLLVLPVGFFVGFYLITGNSLRTFYFFIFTLPFLHQYISALLIIFIIIQLVYEKGRVISITSERYKSIKMFISLFFMFFLVSVLGFNNSFDVLTNFNELLQYFIYFSLFIITVIIWDSIDYKKILKLSALSLSLLSLTFILFHNYPAFNFLKIISVIQTENYMAFFLGVFLVIYFIFLINNKNRKLLLVNMLVLLVMVALLLLTNSRGTLLGVILSLIIIGISKNKRLLILLSFLLGIFIMNFQRLPYEVKRQLLSTLDTTAWYSNLERLRLWESTMQMFYDSPILGNGIGSWKVLYTFPEYINTVNYYPHAHNMYLQLLSEMGLIGFLLFFGMIFYVISYFFKIKKPNLKTICLMGAVIFCLIAGTYDYQMNNSKPAMLFWILLGILYVELKKERFIRYEYSSGKVRILGQRSRYAIIGNCKRTT